MGQSPSSTSTGPETEQQLIPAPLFRLLLPLALLLLLSLSLFSRPVRFFLKLTLYSVCILVASSVGSLASIPFGRTTDNHFLVFGLLRSLVLPWTGLRIRVEGQSLLDSLDSPFVLVANHQSFLDVLTLTFCWPKNCVVVLKRSLLFLPGFNLSAYLCHAIFVDRSNPGKAHASIDSAVEAIKSRKRRIFIFPEGTRNDGEELGPFKKGAFVLAKNAGVPVVPVVFSPYQSFYSFAQRRFHYGGQITIRVLEPIHPEHWTSVDELGQECRRRMNDQFNEMRLLASSDFKRKSSSSAATPKAADCNGHSLSPLEN